MPEQQGPSQAERMTQLRSLVGRWALPMVAAAAAVTVFLTGMVAASPEAGAAQLPAVSVTWQTCINYSDEVLQLLGIAPDRLSEARALLARMECGTVSVPLNYSDPNGRKISVAVNRIKATDQEHRLGMLALNPGGPGGSGYLMSLLTAMDNESMAALNERYDLIGFDPRGVNYSTKVNCPAQGAAPTLAPGPLTEAEAKQLYDQDTAYNQTCGQTDPAFLSQLSTPNVARDLNEIRSALGESKVNLLGVSWGTYLGTVYRTLFPTHSGRMFLDSVLPPVFLKSTKLDDDAAVAAEQSGERFAGWIAERNDTYGLGTTADQVRGALIAIIEDYDQHPRRFSDVSRAVDGHLIAQLLTIFSPVWPQNAQALKELRTAVDGQTAPPTVKSILTSLPPAPPPIEGAPETGNKTMGMATICNDDPERPDFATAWAAYQRRVSSNPLTGRSAEWYSGCSGWPADGRSIKLTRAGDQLVLSGHRYEIVTPYNWANETQKAVGGTLFTVEDDIHGSATRTPDCSAKLLTFFNTGTIDSGCGAMPADSNATILSQHDITSNAGRH
jgi:pimeloyl-ACP methyl ester carboxylesterase